MRRKAFIDFLKSSKTRAIASLLFKKSSDFDVDEMSDYDVFSILCRNMPLLAGHSVRHEFLSVVGNALDEELDIVRLFDEDYQKVIWQRIFDYESILNLSEYNINSRHLLNFDGEHKMAIVLNDSLDLSFENTFLLLDNLLSYIRLNAIGRIVVDMRNIRHCRPNDFSAERCYDELKVGDGKIDASALILWLSCRLLMQEKLQLFMIAEKASDIEYVLELLSVIKLSPDIIACMSVDSCDFDNIFELLINYRKKNISLELFEPKEMNLNMLEEYLNNIISVVPLALIDFSKDYFEKSVLRCAMKNILEDKLGCVESRAFFNELYTE